MNKQPVQGDDVGLLARMLRQVDIFAPMTVGQLEKVLPYIQLYVYGAGETVFSQGDAGDAFYIVHSGKVDIRIKSGFLGLSKKTVASLGPGNFFGETALLSKEPRNATIVTAEPTKLYVLYSVDFQFITRENPAFREEMNKGAERRRIASQHG